MGVRFKPGTDNTFSNDDFKIGKKILCITVPPNARVALKIIWLEGVKRVKVSALQRKIIRCKLNSRDELMVQIPT